MCVSVRGCPCGYWQPSSCSDHCRQSPVLPPPCRLVSSRSTEATIHSEFISPGSLFKGLQWALEEMGRAQEMTGRMSAESGEEGDEDGLEAHLQRVFSSFQTGRSPFPQQPPHQSDAPPAPLPRGDPGGRPQDPPQQQTHVHDGHDWGSAAAVAAVKKLQSMGAQVFAPGSKETVDWGVLAGGSSWTGGACRYVCMFGRSWRCRFLAFHAPLHAVKLITIPSRTPLSSRPPPCRL